MKRTMCVCSLCEKADGQHSENILGIERLVTTLNIPDDLRQRYFNDVVFAKVVNQMFNNLEHIYTLTNLSQDCLRDATLVSLVKYHQLANELDRE